MSQLIQHSRRLALAATLLVASPAMAQDKAPPSYQRAIAAGYKAAVLCSTIFNAGRTEAQAEALELTGIYPDYQPLLAGLTAEVDRTAKTVTVPFDDKLPPRIAKWRANLGCAQLPIGATSEAIAELPQLRPPAPNFDARPWPMGDQQATAAPRGDAAALTAASARAFDGATYGVNSRTVGVLVVQDGRIVEERYAEGFGMHVSNRTWSVAKSIAGTVVGVAVQQGKVAIDRPAGLLEWSRAGDPRARITLAQLMSMASGLHGDTAGSRTDALYFGGATVDETAAPMSLDAVPGTRFRYANNDIVLAIYALRQRLGASTMIGLPYSHLFWKIGMTRTFAETDWKGNFILSSQVWTTARDLARFGLLYQNDGMWNGERVLPADWRKVVTAPEGPQPDGAFGYGKTFWLLNKSAGVPADAFGAFGNRGQYVIIVPSRNIVIVRRAEDPAGAPFDIAAFTRDVLATLK